MKLKIPEGAQSGQEFRIRGKGVPHLNEYGRGDLIAQIVVRTPTKLNKAQKEAAAPARRDRSPSKTLLPRAAFWKR